MTSRRSKRAKLSKASVQEIATKIVSSSGTGSVDLAEKALQQVTLLPELELHSERRKFLEIIEEQCREEFDNLLSSLCQKYSALYRLCQGGNCYLKFQIEWHDFLRSVAAYVAEQSTSDAQVVDYENSESPVANSWLSLVTSVQCNLSLSKETQFAMFHAFARHVYHHMHEKAIAISAKPSPDVPVLYSDVETPGNNLESLIRMCGSQLTRLQNVKMKELERLNKKTTSSLKVQDIQQQIALIEEACMTTENKDAENIKPLLPVCDEGGMRFPCDKLFPFLREFDSVVREEVNYKQFHKLGQSAFQSMQLRMESQKDRLFPLFAGCFSKYTTTTIKEVYTMLFQKMLNLRKKDLEKSWERLDMQNGKNITLNLRDQLKPYATRQK